MLSVTEVRDLSKVSEWRSIFAIATDWGAIALIFWINMTYFHPILWFVSIFLMARFQYALFILKHDAAHSLLFRSKRLNDFVGQLIVCPLLLSLTAYRKHHLLHHRVPLTKEDPDLSLTGGYPITKASFLRKIRRDICGISYFKLMPYYFGFAVGKDSKGDKPSISSPSSWFVWVGLLSNILLMGILWRSGHPTLYFFLWLLPLMSPLQVFLRIRGITEHAGYQPNENQALNTRTVVNSWQPFFLAPHKVNYHLEHHLYPSIPFHRLPETHALLLSRGDLPATNLYHSYADVIRELVSRKA